VIGHHSTATNIEEVLKSAVGEPDAMFGVVVVLGVARRVFGSYPSRPFLAGLPAVDPTIFHDFYPTRPLPGVFGAM
jgi:hypothetical protein